jgi:uncharacterized tellurite resistance protein B-like protein
MNLNYNTTITKLYFLLISADGHVNAKEVALAKQMIKTEGVAESEFYSLLAKLKDVSHEQLLNESIASIKLVDRAHQIRIVAWLCVLANADGFMDRTEWQLIYRIYHTELKLPLNEIFTVQKELNRLVWMSPQPANS